MQSSCVLHRGCPGEGGYLAKQLGHGAVWFAAQIGGKTQTIGVHCLPLSNQTVALLQTQARGSEFQGSRQHFPPRLISHSRAQRGLRPKAIKAWRHGDRIAVYVCIVGQMVNILTTLTLNTHHEPVSVLHARTGTHSIVQPSLRWGHRQLFAATETDQKCTR